MAAAIPQLPDCCTPCSVPETVAVPGPQGPPGVNGTNGTNGINAFTATTANFTMPAEGGSVTVNVGNSQWATIGQIVYVQTAGYMQVTAKPTTTSLTLVNLENTGTSAYTPNAPPGTVIPAASTISPAGLQGPAGTVSGDVMLKSQNLAGLADLPTSRANLGLGTAATATVGKANGQLPPVDAAGGLTSGQAIFATTTGLESKSATAARAALGLAIGTDVQAFNTLLQAFAGVSAAADRLAYFTGSSSMTVTTLTALARSLLDDVTAADMRATLGKVLPRYGELGSLTAVNLNVGNQDNSITIEASRYRIDKVTLENPSGAVLTATAGVFTAPSGGGTTIAATQVLTALSATTKFMDMTLQSVVGTDVFTASQIYFRTGTPEGTARTCSVRVFGWRFD